MLPQLVAFVFQVAAPCPRTAAAASQTDAGWDAYRRGLIAEAAAHFTAADSLCPGDRATQVGLGFVRLRQNQPRAAAERFLQAIRSDARDAEAWYGLGLARARLKERGAAADAWRRALRLAPGYRDAELQLLALGIDSGLALPAPHQPENPDVPARTAGDGFEVRVVGGWQPFYVKGVNLGVALPGHFPSEFPTDDSTYARWLELIAGARANAVRVYTILPPAFYRALNAWNGAHPDSALWLLHGVWTELPPRQDYEGAAWKAAFRAEMRRAVDVVHGHALIAARPGHAFGRYDADVSDHVLAFIIGREWEPFSITVFNRRRHDRRIFSGRFLVVDRGTPADVWMAEQCDYLLGYEWDTYHAQRPIAYTNWPTLDPLSHPTEPTLEEEQRLRRLRGFPPNPRLKEYDNDRESLDAMLVRTTAADVGGYFASYHAYPYYPDFIGLDSAYGSIPGQSHYVAYLRELKRHHAGRPLLVAEYGVPSSRGVSHLEADGMDHGGHDEGAMAEIDARLTREIRDAGAAGGILFAWLDEWFKHTWVTIDLEVPAERTRLWHNVEDAEQHYGLLGEYAGPSPGTPEPGGDPGAWEALPMLGRGSPEALALRAGADPSYLYLALAGGPGLDTARYVVGIDTYRRDRGEFRLPGVDRPGVIGFEFALVLNDTSDAQLLVAPWYNPYLGPRKGMGPTALDPFYNDAVTANSTGHDGAFDSLFVTTNRWRIGRDGRTHAARGVNRGRLRYGSTAESTLTDWYVDRASGQIEVRIAWALLNVTDPSSRQVMVRYRRDGVFEAARTDGFRFAVAALDRASGAAVARLEPKRTYAWPTWEVPTWHERLKPVYFAMREVWGAW